MRSLRHSLLKSFLRLGAAVLRPMLRLVRSNKTLYTMVYDLANVQEFSDLYEHEKMLADGVRVDTYAAAICRNIKAGDVVVDLGTGSGILSMLAARQGATVYAIDHSEFITVAERIAKHNGLADRIRFVRANSKTFACPEKVDVILHEQIGDDLFNENMMENLLDLKRRLLKPGGRILPGRFELFVEPVSLKPAFRVPYVEEMVTHGIDFSCIRDIPDAQKYRSAKYGRRQVEMAAFGHFLSDPQPIVTVDLNEVADEDTLPHIFNAARRVVRPGTMDGLYQFFRVVFDEQTAFDTSPLHTKTHWGNRLFRTPIKEYVAGATIHYALAMESLRHSQMWSASVTDSAGTTDALRQGARGSAFRTGTTAAAAR